MRFGMAILFILGVLVVGAVGYQIGVTQAIPAIAPGTTPVPAVYPYFWHPFGFGFGFLGLLFPLLFFLLIFAAIRGAWGGYGRHGWYGGDRRAMLDQWHREQHGEKPSTTAERREEGPRR